MVAELSDLLPPPCQCRVTT